MIGVKNVDYLFVIQSNLIIPLISSASVIAGTLIGALLNWIINKKITERTINEQYKLREQSRKYQEEINTQEICKYVNNIRLDIATAMFQSIRTIKDIKEGKNTYNHIIPINKNYPNIISCLIEKYNLNDISYIYQLYGIIEKVNHDVLKSNFYDKNILKQIETDYYNILEKLYGENVDKIIEVDIENVQYKDLYDNDLINKKYKNILQKLDKLCYLENLKNLNEES